MTIYNLEEDSNIFFTPTFFDDVFQYRMEHINEDGVRTVIRSIDLRTDKLLIYGTEIKESLFKRLYDSLIIKPKAGIIYVNCEGACFISLPGKCHRPIHNIIFDWSPFGVTIPNSVNDSLSKQVEENKKVIENLNGQLSSNEANLKASMEEVEKLKQQVSTSKKEYEDLEGKLKETFQSVALVEFELEFYKVELESSKKGEEELLDELCSCREKTRNIEVELEKLQAQISAVNCELRDTKIELEASSKSVKEFECQLWASKKESEELERQLRSVQEEHSTIKFELEAIKSEKQYLEVEIEKKLDYIRLINQELMTTNQKLDELLNSELWTKVYKCHICQSRRENEHSSLPSKKCDISSFVIEIT